MLEIIKKIKRLEEFFGAIGFIYLLVLAVGIFFLVRFLTTATFLSLRAAEKSDPLPPVFELERAYEALGIKEPIAPLTSAPVSETHATSTASSSEVTPSTKIKVLSTPTGFLNVRSDPSSTSSLVTKIIPGEIYEYTKEENGWFYIIIPTESLEGWVSERYAEKVIED